MHLLQTTASSLDDMRRAGRSRPDAGRHRGPVVRRQRPRRSRRGLRGGAASAAERAARASARSAPSDVDRPVDRQGGAPRQSDRGAGCSAGSIGGATASRRSRRSRASGTSRWPCCPERTATTRASMRLRPCRPTSLRRLLAFFREGGRENLRALLRRLAGHAGLELDQRRSRNPCRAAPAICRAKAR